MTVPQGDLFERPRPPAPPASERQARDRILDLQAHRRREWLEEIREAMAALFRDRLAAVHRLGSWAGPAGPEREAWVSADDARGFFEARYPGSGINRNFLGAVFRDGAWRALPGRRVLSQTAGSHANELKCWQWIRALPTPSGASS